ncbi:hypothetical protein GCM10011391_35530 [Pullulanibacillus camelliae]|uniref:DUF2785 domain-containing protein n=1 Tax=Pullulanibacillus camelliae TaxID=1707096 RepID=A0A8J2YMY8_9BACL|nr:DUF2785 domain-containing protein [Pullulanibacillus camelliae]GGE53560.1 hypothetical protein GCM10011391_35530 [Pullulanibacillus camelliae]
MTLKSELKNLETTLQHSNLDILIERMLVNVGSTDSELRDTLIYNSFGKLIFEDYLTIKQMNHIFEVCLRNLFLDIGQKENDSVFTRSFSALVIVLVLKKDRDKRFLSDEILKQSIEGSIKYLKLEEDIRGYVVGKGWGHSIAHGADLLTEAISHPNFNIELSSECLETIKLCLFKDSTIELPFVDEEEERLIFAVEALQEKGVTDSEMENWILKISDELNELLEKEGYSLNFFWKKSNVINFLRGYYFRLLYKNDCLKLREKIANILEQWHKQMYN